MGLEHDCRRRDLINESVSVCVTLLRSDFDEIWLREKVKGTTANKKTQPMYFSAVPSDSSQRQHHGCVHSSMLGELEEHLCFWAEDEKRPSWTEFVMKEKLGCLCRERENLRDISASLFFKLPSCFWNPWAPFTPWLYLYHKNTISGSGVGARQWNTFQTKQMQTLQMEAKQQIKHHFVLAHKDCKKEDTHLFHLKYYHNTNQHKSFTNTELY